MKKTILLATTLVTLAFGAAGAAESPSTMVPKTQTAPMTAAIVTPMATTRPGDHLTSRIIGGDVYSKTGEKIGDINDLIVDASGNLSGVVVGVGGFLGVGEKNVALPWTALTIGADEKGKPRLTVDVTKDMLHQAPTFAPAKV